MSRPWARPPAYGVRRRHMACAVNRLPPGPAMEAVTLDRHGEAAKNQPPHSHLVDQGVEPLEQQIGEVGRLASHLDRLLRQDSGRVCDYRSQREGGLLEGGFRRRPDAAHPDIGVVRKQLGAGFDRR